MEMGRDRGKEKRILSRENGEYTNSLSQNGIEFRIEIYTIFGTNKMLRFVQLIEYAMQTRFGKCGKTPNKYDVRDACVVYLYRRNQTI